MAILEEAVQSKGLTVADVHQMVVESGVETQRESVQMIREDRDSR